MPPPIPISLLVEVCSCNSVVTHIVSKKRKRHLCKLLKETMYSTAFIIFPEDKRMAV